MSKKQNAAKPLPEEGTNKTEDAQFPIVKYGKMLVFLLLVIIEIIFAVSNRQYYYWIVPAAIVLTTENAIKIWGLKSYKPKIACYVLDVLILLVLTYFSDGNLISTLYIIILSEFYLTQKKTCGQYCHVRVRYLFVFDHACRIKRVEKRYRRYRRGDHKRGKRFVLVFAAFLDHEFRHSDLP